MSIPVFPRAPGTASQSRSYLLTAFAYHLLSPAHNNDMRVLHPINLQASKLAPRPLIFPPAGKSQNTLNSRSFSHQAVSHQQLESKIHKLPKKSKMRFLRVHCFIKSLKINNLTIQTMYQLINTAGKKTHVFVSKTPLVCLKTPFLAFPGSATSAPLFAPPRPNSGSAFWTAAAGSRCRATPASP
jgi:hypothetical protein